jgi:hypothetical protein
MVIKTAGKMVDTLKSTFETISKDELLEKLGTSININIPQNVKVNIKVENTFLNWLDENIIYSNDSILTISTIIFHFTNKKLASRSLGQYRLHVEKWIKERFKNVNYKYQDTTYHTIKYKGWRNLKIKNSV